MERVSPTRLADEFSEVAGALRPQLHAVARKVVTNHSDAEDVVQEALKKAFQGLPGFRGEASLATWLTKITRNEALILLRKRRRNWSRLAEPPSAERVQMQAFDAEEPSPEELCIRQQRRRLLWHSVERMRPGYRTVLVLRFRDGLNVDRIADKTGLSVGAVKSRIHRARLVLRRSLGHAHFASVMRQ